MPYKKFAPNALLRKLVPAYAFLKSCVRSMIDISIDSKLNTGQEYAKIILLETQVLGIRLRPIKIDHAGLGLNLASSI